MEVIKPAEAPSSIDAFYEKMYTFQNSSGKCSGILCVLNSADYFAGDTAANQSSSSPIFLGSMLLGQMRFRQVRVQKTTCSSFYQKLEDIECYPEYAAGQEETTYTKDWAPDFDTSVDAAFKYQSQADTGEVNDCFAHVFIAHNAAHAAVPVVSDCGRVHHVPRQATCNRFHSRLT
jgi:hypothetical protein